MAYLATLLSGFVVIADDALSTHAALLRRINVMATRSNTSGFERSRTVRSLGAMSAMSRRADYSRTPPKRR